MKQSILICILLFMPFRDANAKSPRILNHDLYNIAIQQNFKYSQEPLTTEKILVLDPAEENPNRMLWVLEKKVKIDRIQHREIDALFGFTASGVLLDTQFYIRSIEKDLQAQKGCPSPEEARRAGKQEATKWENLLKKNRLKLAYRLERVRAISKEQALLKGMEVFSNWIEDFDRIWHFNFKKNQSGRCGKEKKVFETPAILSSRVLLTRAPARLWNGFYTVRLSFLIASKALNGKLLNGQFLIEPSTPQSIVSPFWLESQGISPEQIEKKDFLPQKVIWSGPTGLANTARVEKVYMSGVTIPIYDFLIFDTERFFPPTSLKSCCDGVLGDDFLRLFAVEFSPEAPTEVKLFERKGFSLGTEAPYVDIESDQGDALKKATAGKSAFTIDLAQGRIWFSKANFEKKNLTNQSGLKLQFRFNKTKDRTLYVSEIKKTSLAESLIQAGLKIGSSILSIDAKPCVDMDQWEVDQRLTGRYGKTIVLEWMSARNRVKLTPFTVR
jgi:hypothetical protein